MAKYRKKPVVVEAWDVAWLLLNAAQHWNSLPECSREIFTATYDLVG